MQSETGGTTGPMPQVGGHPDAGPGAGPSGRRPAPRPGAGPANKGPAAPAPDSWKISTDQADPGSIRALYENFVAARKRNGEERVPGFDTFARDVARHAQTIKSKADCSSVEFRIYSKDNKVTLKARPVVGPASKDKG
jgi:hypothetical protein